MTTYPIDKDEVQTAPRLAIAPFYKDAKTGALYVHQDMDLAQAPWAEEEHISPMRASESFGDVVSWASYVGRYGEANSTCFLTWNSRGLKAVLDYYSAEENTPDRCQWTASHPFAASKQWAQWMNLANGQAVAHRAAVERLEDLAADIVEPAPADLMSLLRGLRASVKSTADVELRPDGTSAIAFTKDTSVQKGNSLSIDLPPTFTIAIPVLKGHTDDEGRPVLYKLAVRLRVSPDDNAHLAFRFSVPLAERVLEEVYADRVRLATDLLGDKYVLLRAAD